MKEHLARMQTGEYCEPIKFYVLLGIWRLFDQTGEALPQTCCLSPVWHGKDAATSPPQDRCSIQASLLALAGGGSLHSCLPALGQFASTAVQVCKRWTPNYVIPAWGWGTVFAFSLLSFPPRHRAGHNLTVLLSKCKGRQHLQHKHLVSVPLHDTF